MASLESLEAQINGGHRDWLTPMESQHLAAMGSVSRRRQFLAGHWLARRMASTWFGGDVLTWSFEVRASGHRVVQSANGRTLQVSISHSGTRVACAIGTEPMGLDLEGPRKRRDLPALARVVLSPAEQESLRQEQDDAQRSAAFYRYWTLKEARGKYEGEGLRPERARHWTAERCAAAEASALSWCLGADSLALFSGRAQPVTLIGVDPMPEPEHWRFDDAAYSGHISRRQGLRTFFLAADEWFRG